MAIRNAARENAEAAEAGIGVSTYAVHVRRAQKYRHVQQIAERGLAAMFALEVADIDSETVKEEQNAG